MLNNLQDVKCTDRAKELVQPPSGELWNYVESCKATRSGLSHPNNYKQIHKSDKRLIPKFSPMF